MNDTKVIAIANQKGGVSKTTTSLNIAYSLSNYFNKNVLLIDMDSQGSASLNLGIDINDENTNTIDWLLEPLVTNKISYPSWEDIKSAIYTPTYEDRQRDPNNKMKWISVNKKFGNPGRFDVLPSSIQLAIVELQMGIASGISKKLSPNYLEKVISVIKKMENYDYIILDCPPSLSSLFLNSIYSASDGTVAVSSLDIMSLRGIDNLIESVESVQKLKKNHRGILGIMFAMFSDRRSVDRDLNYYAEKYLPIPVFDTKIPESSDAKKANQSMLLYSQLNKKANLAFQNLAKEIIYAIENPTEPVGSLKRLNGTVE